MSKIWVSPKPRASMPSSHGISWESLFITVQAHQSVQQLGSSREPWCTECFFWFHYVDIIDRITDHMIEFTFPSWSLSCLKVSTLITPH